MKINIEWQRCPDGYAVTNDGTSFNTEYISPRTKNIEKIFPLESHTALLRQLSGIETRRGFLHFAKHNGLLSHSTNPEPISLWISSSKIMRSVLKQPLDNRSSLLKVAFKEKGLGDLQIDLETSKNPPFLSVSCQSLIQAIWWQFIQATTYGQSFEICSWCSTWFSVGPETGRRRRQAQMKNSFCSPKHQGLYSYQNMKNGRNAKK